MGVKSSFACSSIKNIRCTIPYCMACVNAVFHRHPEAQQKTIHCCVFFGCACSLPLPGARTTVPSICVAAAALSEVTIVSGHLFRTSKISGHTCVQLLSSIPPQDGHDSCLSCLGIEHAWKGCEQPEDCMNCFILPAHAREARWQFLKLKRMSSSTSTPQPKRARQDVVATVAALAQQVKDLTSRLGFKLSAYNSAT